MNLISIPSKSCPKCGHKRRSGKCSIVLTEVQTIKAHSIKVKEDDLRAELSGTRGPEYREAYLVQEIVCGLAAQ